MIHTDIGSISVSANTQGCNIGIVSEVKKLYQDIPKKKTEVHNTGPATASYKQSYRQ